MLIIWKLCYFAVKRAAQRVYKKYIKGIYLHSHCFVISQNKVLSKRKNTRVVDIALFFKLLKTDSNWTEYGYFKSR